MTTSFTTSSVEETASRLLHEPESRAVKLDPLRVIVGADGDRAAINDAGPPELGGRDALAPGRAAIRAVTDAIGTV